MSDKPLLIHVNDYFGMTMHLDAAEHGALLQLLSQANDIGPLEDDEVELARAARCGLIAWRRIRPSIEQFWLIEDGHWHSKLLARWEDIRRRQFRPAIPTHVRKAVRERDGERCVYCGDEAGPFHLDHVVPYSRGGDHEVDNLVVACATCNVSKGAKTLEEWAA